MLALLLRQAIKSLSALISLSGIGVTSSSSCLRNKGENICEVPSTVPSPQKGITNNVIFISASRC